MSDDKKVYYRIKADVMIYGMPTTALYRVYIEYYGYILTCVSGGKHCLTYEYKSIKLLFVFQGPPGDTGVPGQAGKTGEQVSTEYNW